MLRTPEAAIEGSKFSRPTALLLYQNRGKTQDGKEKTVKRENGCGSVYKRGDVKSRPWLAVAPTRYITDPETGKVKAIREHLGTFATAQEAKDALEEFRRNPTTKVNITFSEVYSEWSAIAFRNISKQTQDNYTAAYAKFASLYREKFRELRTGQYQAVIDYYSAPFPAVGKGGTPKRGTNGEPVMSSPLSSSSLSKMKILLTQLYDYALQNDIVHKNYASFITLPKQEKTVKDCFSELEVKKIEQAVGTVPYADCILLMCYTGFRIAEFLELRPENYNSKNKTLTGGKKTDAGRNRIVPVHRKVQGILDARLAMKGETIICNEQGKAYRTEYFRRQCYYPALDTIGVRRLTPHATRHTFATRLSAAGARTEDIQALAGHEDYEMTANTYIHQDVETLRRAIEKMA